MSNAIRTAHRPVEPIVSCKHCATILVRQSDIQRRCCTKVACLIARLGESKAAAKVEAP